MTIQLLLKRETNRSTENCNNITHKHSLHIYSLWDRDANAAATLAGHTVIGCGRFDQQLLESSHLRIQYTRSGSSPWWVAVRACGRCECSANTIAAARQRHTIAFGAMHCIYIARFTVRPSAWRGGLDAAISAASIGPTPPRLPPIVHAE